MNSMFLNVLLWFQMCVVSVDAVFQVRVARLEQLEKELQEARGAQETQLQVRLWTDGKYLHQRTQTGAAFVFSARIEAHVN